MLEELSNWLFLTPEQAAQVQWTYPDFGTIVLFLLGIVFFLFLNAFFVANEFASARVRESQLVADVEDKPRDAKSRQNALHIVRHLDSYLSANQVGITIASLALGNLGEPFIEQLIAPPLSYYLHLQPVVVSTISYIVSYSLFTFAHVVLGELVPKSLAIRHPLRVALSTANGMVRFARSTSWVVKLFNNTANGIAHVLFGVDPHYAPNNSHSAEEIAHIVEEGGKSNEVTETEAEISMNALELNDRSVREIFVPRNDVEVLDINEPFEVNLELVSNSRHSRFALVDGHLDDVKGWVHVKDMLKLVRSQSTDIMSVRRPLKVVPETMKLDTLLNFFSKERTHSALVVDEHGVAVGMVYLDDVLEEIVGDDIQDEFEEDESSDFYAMDDGQYVVNGSMTLFDLEEEIPGIGDLQNDAGVSTLGGYITERLGHIPEVGEQITIRDFTITVTATDGRRVTQAQLHRSPAAAPPEGPHSASPPHS